LPARPVPVATPAVRCRGAACPVRLLAPTVAEAHRAPPVALRSGRVASLVASAVILAVVGGLDWIGSEVPPAAPADTTVTRAGAGEPVWM
ncbi:MAG TPA: hypothetical protein VF734_01620, partial [Pseudonocardiaceae bacterium]